MDIFTQIVLIILGVSSVITVLEVTGLIDLVPYFGKKIRKSKVKPTLDILQEMGLDLEKSQSALIASKIARPTGDAKKDIDKLIKKHCLKIDVEVGKTNPKLSKDFWDVIGATTNPNTASNFARKMSAKWKEILQNEEAKEPKIDFIVTPKDGSPLLGYEFAKIVDKPFALYSDSPKFIIDDDNYSFFANFDMSEKPIKGSVALIVDDSSTGGRKVVNAIKSLRKHGYKVSDCLVVFEPTFKTPKPRELFQSNGVKLHSIVEKKS